MKHFAIAAALAALTTVALPAAAAPPPKADAPATAWPALQLLEQFSAPNVHGRLDHMTLDRNHLRFFISAVGNDTIEVFDFSAAKWIFNITGLNSPKGIIYVPEVQKLFSADVGDGTLKVYDNSYHVIKTIVIGHEADYLRYDPVSKKLLTGYGGNKDEGGLLVIDPTTYEVTQIAMDAPPEDFAIDAEGQYVYANLHDLPTVEVIDLKAKKVVKRWDYKNAFRPTPMALNSADHRLYIASRNPADLMVINTDTGKEIARVPLGGLSAELLFEPSSKRLYNINSAGYINVIQQRDPDHYELVENVPTVVGARTGYLVPSISRLMIAVPAYGDRPAGMWEYQTNVPPPGAK